ncbi:glycosyl hydrolase [Neolewinella antarctica]|uniref:Intracellular protease/amidase n=1 Tax=Neolewinella antarctica TaxID=442734 RepID=A0ABX0XGY3_9BACT|nr:glycosyl hydrolase [Neolewinella antarctica]NJC28462.1 putative intracellular protease/amidase [Neolewinella antarctica]
MPFWHINGELTHEGIEKQMRDAKELAGFSGISVLPLNDGVKTNGDPKFGTLPEFLSEDYFEQFQHVLTTARELDMEVILYDDIDFPSGMAGGKMESKYPEHTIKRLDLVERALQTGTKVNEAPPEGKLLSVVAMDSVTKEIIDLRPQMNAGRLAWMPPAGAWKLMYFVMRRDSFHKKYLVMDFMDTVAVRHFINETYERYYARFPEYFGNTIKVSFFDDVGFWRHPRTWTPSFDDAFTRLNGYEPHNLYPALWYDIGPETESARHAFFLTRAELLAEGFPKLVGEWAKAHGIEDTGHPPGNYDPTPIDMNGDIFKFFRHTAIPLTDAIIRYQFGQDGHKLISSAADFYDRPVVATEIYGAFPGDSFDSLMLYREMMDLFVRGVNRVVPHGLWYNYNPNEIYISPLVSPYNEKIAAALPAYSEFVGRGCQLLQGGRRVANIGVLYPFESLAGWYRFEDEDNPRQGFFVAPETDYQTISGWLTNALHRDFTFVHPEYFLEDKYVLSDGKVHLKNEENFQSYDVMMLTGGKVISAATLGKLRDFYVQGGTVIATTQLPWKSSEKGKDTTVVNLVREIFGVVPGSANVPMGDNKNDAGGHALFLPNPDQDILAKALNRLAPTPDVIVTTPPRPVPKIGKFSYIHKVKDGRDVYYFSNSSDERVTSEVSVKGAHVLRQWDPHTGKVSGPVKSEFVNREGAVYTRFQLTLAPVRSVFYLTEDVSK